MTISINRALAELKLIAKKIEQKTVSLEVTVCIKSDLVDEFKKDFVTKSTSAIQQVKDLIERRNKLKSAIVTSNAFTTVLVSKKQMTVAEAIERKSSIELERSLCRQLREKYFTSKKGIENHNAQVDKDADKAALQALGADTEGNKGEAYKSIVDAYKLRNKAELLAPEGIEKDIEEMQDAIDEFECEVDFALSESNIKTMIEV